MEQRVNVVPSLGRTSRHELFGVWFDLLSGEELKVWLRSILAGSRLRNRIAFSNPEFVLEAQRNDALRVYLNACERNVIDGVGLIHAFRLVKGLSVPERNTGTHFVETLCRESAASGARLFIYGGARGVAERARARLDSAFPGVQIAGVIDGFQPEERVLEHIRAAAPDVLMVCLGNPKQEAWIDRHLPSLDVKLVFGNGGAVDFWAGDVPMAPRTVQRLGLEWLFRLITNFSRARLKRQLKLGSFIRMTIRERLSRR